MKTIQANQVSQVAQENLSSGAALKSRSGAFKTRLVNATKTVTTNATRTATITATITATLTAAMLGGAPALADESLDGMWRGKLEVQDGIYLTVGYTIRDGEVTMDSPNQGMFDKSPTTFELEGNRLELSDNELSASFSGEFSGDTLEGTFTQGRAFPLTLHRLQDDAQERLEFEGRYAGDLLINNRSKLPLQVNVAVVHDGYYVTLDSPAQQSYGIPVEEFSIDESQMSFSSQMINASYSASWSDGAYQGEFEQGQVRPLSLKRVEEGEPQASVPKPQLGEHGGAVAVLTGDKVNTHYFLDHSADTQYEIGSVSKTMVGYLLAKALVEEQFEANTEVRKLWPAGPEGVPVLALATHRSGIPRLPDNLFEGANPEDPYAHYDHALMNEALSELTLKEPDYEYSNFGFGLLGELLAKRVGTTFEALIKEALLAPASMNNSYVAISGTETPGNLAQGHDLFGEPAVPWHFQALAGAGGVVSTLPDMINYVNFMRQGVANGDPVVQKMLEVQAPMADCCDQALAWIIGEDEQGNKYAWHNGQTGGYGAYVAFYLDGSRAVVVLNNQSASIDSPALALLTGKRELSEFE